jgi:chromosome segregation ATPase
MSDEKLPAALAEIERLQMRVRELEDSAMADVPEDDAGFYAELQRAYGEDAEAARKARRERTRAREAEMMAKDAIIAGLRRDLVNLQGQMTDLQDRHNHLNSAHYKVSTELSELKFSPDRQNAHVTKLLEQMGQLKSQLFDEQARTRELNHQCEQYRNRTPELKAQQEEAGAQLLATLESTQRAYGVAYGERHARSLPASTQDMIAKRETELVARTQQQLDRERYEMLIGAVKDSRAVTVGGLKKKILGLLSDMVDDLAEGDDDE